MVRPGFGIRSGPLVSSFGSSQSKAPPVRKTRRLWVRPPCRCILDSDIESSDVESTGVSDDSAFAGDSCLVSAFDNAFTSESDIGNSDIGNSDVDSTGVSEDSAFTGADGTSSAFDNAFTSESDWEPPATEPICLITDALASAFKGSSPKPTKWLPTLGQLVNDDISGRYPYGGLWKPTFDGRLDVDNEFLVPPGCVLPDGSGVYVGTRWRGYGEEPEILVLPLADAKVQLSTPEFWTTLRRVETFISHWTSLQVIQDLMDEEKPWSSAWERLEPQRKNKGDIWRRSHENLQREYDKWWEHQENLRRQHVSPYLKN